MNAKEFSDAPLENTVNDIERHVGKDEIVRYDVGWYGYTPADFTVEPREHFPEHFITCNWRRTRKNDEVRQGGGRAHANRRLKVPK